MDARAAIQIARWAQQLEPGDPFRWLVQRALDGRPLRADALQSMLRVVERPDGHPWPAVAICTAIVSACDLPAGKRARVVAAARSLALGGWREPAQPLSEVRTMGCAAAGGLATLAVSLCAAWLAAQPAEPEAMGAWLLGGLTCGLGLAVVIGLLASSGYSGEPDRGVGARAVRSAAVSSLARMGDPESLGTFAAASYQGPDECKVDARTALVDILGGVPGGTAERYWRLAQGPIAQALLAHAGASDWAWGLHEPTARAILDAYDRAGDTTAVEVVRAVAIRSPIVGLHGRANEVLRGLEARKAQEQDVSRLLRAAHAPVPGTLLRPAPADSIPPEALLRPAEPADG